MKCITIYTDGACSGNPGPGGWGAVLLYGNVRKEISGNAENTTNNRMELTAALEALKAIKEPCKIELYTDSTYLCNAFNKHWIDNWLTRVWKTAAGKPVENQDIWQELLRYVRVHEMHFHKVKGHSSNIENNRCDALARAAVKDIRQAIK